MKKGITKLGRTTNMWYTPCIEAGTSVGVGTGMGRGRDRERHTPPTIVVKAAGMVGMQTQALDYHKATCDHASKKRDREAMSASKDDRGACGVPGSRVVCGRWRELQISSPATVRW